MALFSFGIYSNKTIDFVLLTKKNQLELNNDIRIITNF